MSVGVLGPVEVAIGQGLDHLIEGGFRVKHRSTAATGITVASF